MKKILALTLALLLVASMFAACGNEETPATNDPTQGTIEATDPAPEATDAPEQTEAPANYAVIEKLSKHENGWVQNTWGNDSYGVYFNAFANDAPYGDSEEYIYYRPVSEDAIKLVRDGETYDLGNPFVDFLHKGDRTAYYLRLEKWMLDEYFPIVNGDMIIVEGDFYNADYDFTIHINKVYMTFAGDMVKFSQTDPTVE